MVAILAVLALITLPNFLAAQTRAKVSATQVNIRTIKAALEIYRLDNGVYPATDPILGRDPLGVLADAQLRVMTSPVAYLSPAAFRDPFGRVRNQMLVPQLFTEIVVPNVGLSLLYVHYPSFAVLTENPYVRVDGSAIVSLGPDLYDSFGVFGPFPPEAMPSLGRSTGRSAPINTVYDPTNGAVSSGDITGFVGDPRLR